MSALPPESERLLAVSPDDFVTERERLVKALRDDGKSAEADAVAALRKPSTVVFAVNRAARDRPKAAEAAAIAAAKVEKTQGKGDLEGFRAAMRELDKALDLLGEVGVARVSPSGKKATDGMRRRVHELLRRAVARDETREALRRGALVEEQEAAGFAAIPGVAPKPKPRERAKATKDARAERAEKKRREREAALRAELADAEKALAEAAKVVRAAEHERTTAERSVASARKKLDRPG
ncbi:MAG: hypothetical protein H0U05_02090 [Actinobacteria bacterium]|nr:hypothetical protein [Actinomycetota bacterium]